MEVTAVCQLCGKTFKYDLKPGFPRKYCPECSAKKKAEFERRNPTTQNTPVVRPGEVKKEVAETESKKDPVRAMRLTEKYFELNELKPSQEEMLACYKYFLINL